MQILVTNDDGIESAGIHALAQHLSTIGEVTVFAPSGEYSGAGAAIGHLADGIADVMRVVRPEMPDVGQVYHFDGPPALASFLACKGLFGFVPDVVVSGINPGWNVGHAVHFSGTIGACITASVFDVPAVAVSQHTAGGPEMQWQTAAQAAADQLPRAMDEGSVLSVNVPNIAASQVKGVVQAELANRIPYAAHSLSLTETEPDRFAVDFKKYGSFDLSPGTDTHAVEAGYIAVTRLAPTRANN